MATIKLGGMIADARGKVGGVVLSRNRGGNYMKTFKKPVNPQTELQQQNRGNFGTIASAYRDLDASQQASWREYAVNYPTKNKVGEVTTLSGAQLHAKCNMVLRTANLSMISVLPPSPVSLDQITGDVKFAATSPWLYDAADPTSVIVGLVRFETGNAAWTPKAGQYVQFYASNQLSSGVNATSSASRRLIESVPLSDFTLVGTTIEYDLGPAWSAAFRLGPSIYNKDSSIVVTGGVFDESEGVVVPIAKLLFKIDEQ